MMTQPSILEIRIVPRDRLLDVERGQVIALCNRAYEQDLTELMATFVSPTHVLGYSDGALVSHAMWVTRYLQVGSQAPLHTAYIEAVATEPACQGRGFATAIMRRMAQAIVDFDLAALSPSSEAYYARLGWETWRGPLSVRTEHGLIPSPPDERVMILRLPRTPADLDITQPLSAEWREGEIW